MASKKHGHEKSSVAGKDQHGRDEVPLVLPPTPSVWSPIYTLEEYYGALVYGSFFGFGRGGILWDEQEPGALKFKPPGFSEVVYYPMRETTGEITSDKIPNRGPAGLSKAEIDLMAKELGTMMSLPLPKVTTADPRTIKTTAYASFTWEATYTIFDGIRFASLDPKFQRNVLSFIESTLTRRLNEVIPVFFYEDLSFLDGRWIMSGKDHHIWGVEDEKQLKQIHKHYKAPGGPQRWAWLKEKKYKTGTWRFALQLTDEEAEELRDEAPDCPLLQLRDRGIELRFLGRQAITTSEAIQKRLDEQADVELERRIQRGKQGIELDAARKDIIIRRYHALASAENLVTEIVEPTKMIKAQLALDQMPPIELVFEMAYGYNFLRTMRLAPENKYLLTDIRGTLEMVAKKFGSPDPSNVDGFVNALLKKFGVNPFSPQASASEPPASDSSTSGPDDPGPRKPEPPMM